MTENTPDSSAAASPATNEVAPKKARNTLGLVALILAVLGAILAVIPATNGFSWVILLGAFVVAIVGLTRKGQGKGTSLAALIVSFVFWLISVFVGIGVIATGVAEEIDDPPAVSQPDDAPATEEEEEDAPAEEAAGAGIGDTVTTDDGVEVTLAGIRPGVEAPNNFIVDDVRGVLVAVDMSMTNGSDEVVSISSSSVQGFVGNAEYESVAVFDTDSESWYVYEDINPGLTANFTAYFDVPEDRVLDRVTFLTAIILGDEATFTIQ